MNDMFFLDSDPENLKVVASTEMEVEVMSDVAFKNLLFKYPELGDIMLHTFDLRVTQYANVL